MKQLYMCIWKDIKRELQNLALYILLILLILSISVKQCLLESLQNWIVTKHLGYPWEINNYFNQYIVHIKTKQSLQNSLFISGWEDVINNQNRFKIELCRTWQFQLKRNPAQMNDIFFEHFINSYTSKYIYLNKQKWGS